VTIKQQLTQEQGSKGAFILQSPKNGKSRAITPAPAVMRMLRKRDAQQKRDRLKAGTM